MPLPTYKSTFAHLSNLSYKGGMEVYYDLLRPFVALPSLLHSSASEARQ